MVSLEMPRDREKKMKKKARKKYIESNLSPLTICGKEYRLFWRKGGGGYFEGVNNEIYIGKDMADENVNDALFHEVGEALMMELGLRYSSYGLAKEDDRYPNAEYLFILTHKDWDNFARLLYGALKKFIIPMRRGRIRKRKRKKKGKRSK